MSKCLVFLVSTLLVSPAFGAEKQVVGCWEAEIEEFKNVVTICINHKVGSITTYFSNKGTKSEPTRCYQPGWVEYESNGNAVLEGIGGFCDNDLEQSELVVKCEPSSGDNMQCELYSGYHQLKAKKVKRTE